MPSPRDRFVVNAQWLITLRWVAIIGQVVTITGVRLIFGIELPTFWALVIIISLTTISNLFLNVWFVRWANGPRRPLPWDLILGLVMLMDMLSLTTLLYATGGPNNPFALFFFVNLSLSALVLNRNWAWGLNLLSVACFAWLLFDHHQLEQLNPGVDMLPISERKLPSLAQLGLLSAFTTCSGVIVYFMTRVTGEVRKQQLEVKAAEARQARAEKIEALGTLAAGTAHELATPLSTIAVVARDVEKALDEHPPDFPGAEEVIEDISLIRSQLDRCRHILDRMASHAGQAVGETLQAITMDQLVEEVLADMSQEDFQRIDSDMTEEDGSTPIRVPVVGLSQALRGLVQNAIDADPSGKNVQLKVRVEGGFWTWRIRDYGIGMPDDVLQRVSEPFFTTKSPGSGMGLGVFLAKNVINRLGGKIRFQSQAGEGTEVTVEMPVE
ncbi:MAG: ATP-binding protein [Planctomycetota bacterium]